MRRGLGLAHGEIISKGRRGLSQKVTWKCISVASFIKDLFIKRSGVGDGIIMVDVDRTVGEMEGGLTLSRDIRRACQLLEKLQKSKYCGEVTIGEK